MNLRVSEIDGMEEVMVETSKSLMREDMGAELWMNEKRERNAKVERWRGNLYKKGQAG